MTYQIYSQQQLQQKSIARLKQIYSKIGASVEVADKRCKECWITAFALGVAEDIANYQATQSQKATGEQAQPTANVPLTPIEISFYDHEYYAGDKLIAAISYDDDLTQPWVVMVNNKEVHRGSTVMLCHRYISTHYKDGSLPVQEQDATDTNGSTENQIMAHIFNECQNYGFEILDDGIYHNDVKLGEVGCTDGNWWMKRGCSGQQQYCNSVMDAVRTLSMLDTMPHDQVADYEELLEQPFEMLTNHEWESLRSQPQPNFHNGDGVTVNCLAITYGPRLRDRYKPSSTIINHNATYNIHPPTLGLPSLCFGTTHKTGHHSRTSVLPKWYRTG